MIDTMNRPLLYLAIALLALISGVGMMIGEGQSNTGSDMFRQCATDRVDAVPINVVIFDELPWIESTVYASTIQVVMGIIGEPLAWDSSSGVTYPDNMERASFTIGITLSDGSIVRFIADGWHGGYYYGWLTDSTQMYGAIYNPQPNPHVRCGYWRVATSAINVIREQFRVATRFNTFNYDAR